MQVLTAKGCEVGLASYREMQMAEQDTETCGNATFNTRPERPRR